MHESYGNRTLTAFFDSWTDAQEAASRLRTLGIPDNSVRIVGEEGRTDRAGHTGQDKGFWESLGDLFFPDDDRAVYAEGLRRGGTLLTVTNIPAERYEQTLDILDDEGSVDIDSRAESWRSEGWTAGSHTASPTTAAGNSAATSTSGMRFGSSTADRGEDVIPVVEEELRVGKRDVNLGRVRVRSYVVEEPVSEAVSLREERVFVERRPVDRAVSGGDSAFADRVIEAEEHAEEAVVSKEARVKEEIALRREAEQRTETVSDTVRRTEVSVEDDRTGGIEPGARSRGKPIPK